MSLPLTVKMCMNLSREKQSRSTYCYLHYVGNAVIFSLGEQWGKKTLGKMYFINRGFSERAYSTTPAMLQQILK